MAQGGARALWSLLVTVLVLAALGGTALGLWSLRPTPVFSSGAVDEGSAFDAVFRAENTSTWLPNANLRLGCVLAQVRASGREPTLVEAEQVGLPTNGIAGLAPGEAATFRCPFRTLMGGPSTGAATGLGGSVDAEAAKRAEIYFRATYDVPLLGDWLGRLPGWMRITDDSGRFFLDTRLLPPRWMPVEKRKP